MRRSLVTFAMCWLALGCGDGSGELQADGGAGTVGSGGARDAAMKAEDATASSCTSTRKLDLLFVIDDSPSMKEEQASLNMQLPKLVNALATGDVDGDGTADLTPVASLHLGVVNVNMGANGVQNIKNCGGFGGDGILLSRIRPENPSCAGKANLPIYQEYVVPADGSAVTQEAGRVAADFACVADVGTEGCGFEQQLEAMWKALAPSQDMSFSRGTRGHGDVENQGFLRDDAVLGVVLVTDEEDCSIQDAAREMFVLQTSDESFQGQGFNVRCGLHAEDDSVMWPVSRYGSGLKSLKPHDPSQIVFMAIAGVPQGAESATFDELLGRADMKYMPDGDIAKDTTIGKPACQSERGRADPARRLVKTAQMFGDNGLVRSICSQDFAPAIDGFLRTLAKQLGKDCR